MTSRTASRRVGLLRWVFRRHQHFRGARGQAIVEMVMTTLGVAVVILTAIEGSILFSRGMAVHQLAYQAARYAAANPGYDNSTVLSFASQAVPSALRNGQLSVVMNPNTTPRTQGSEVSVTVSFTGPVMGIPSVISFPGTLTATDTAMSQ